MRLAFAEHQQYFLVRCILRTKMIFAITLIILVLTMVGCTPSNDPESNDISNQIYTNLISSADLIVKGKVLSEKDRVTKTSYPKTKDKNSVGVTLKWVIYDIEVVESLKNPENHKNFSLALIDPNISFSSLSQAKIDIEKEYLFLLKYDSEKKDYISLNYENGVYEWDNDLDSMRSLTDHNIINYDLLKSTIKKLNTK